VISQNPVGGTDVPPGTAVDLVVSDGAAPIDVPNIVSLTQSAAESAIVAGGLTVGTITTQFSSTVPAGSVISQNPGACTGCVSPGSAVDLVISDGPANTVPVVVISSPADETNATESTPLTFIGTAQDAEDGDLTSILVWTSNKDGALGSGSTTTATLSKGRHLITATATDGDGASGTAEIVVRIKKR